MSGIPVVIINRDRAAPLRALVEFCLRLEGMRHIFILDNASTYPGTLRLYDDLAGEGRATVVRMQRNLGYGAVREFLPLGMVSADRPLVVSDPDLEPYPDTPLDLLPRLLALLGRYAPRIVRVGVSLPYDHVPRGAPMRPWMEHWEAKMWKRETPCGQAYFAPTAETFALYPNARPWQRDYSRSLRAKPPCAMRHGDWARSPDDADEEYRYYSEHCERDASQVMLFRNLRRDPEGFRAALRRARRLGRNSEFTKLSLWSGT